MLDETTCNKLYDLKTELNAIDIEKAKGTIIRSRAIWSGEGEKSTAYFLIWKSIIVLRNTSEKL